MYSNVGVRVFPTEASASLLRSPEVIHFSPNPEPPIDYTLKLQKPRKRPDYLVSVDVLRKEPSPDYEHEEDALRSTPRRSTERRSTQVVGEVLHGRQRQHTLTESEMVLEDLESTLEEAIRPKPKPWSERRHRSVERARSFAEKGQGVAPVMKETVIEDLRSLAGGERLKDVNNGRKQMVIDMYEKTRRLIEEARSTYTPQFFLQQYDDRPIPDWQKQLLATRASKETLRKYEEKAWEEFDEWKRQCAPQVQLKAEYRFSKRPVLR